MNTEVGEKGRENVGNSTTLCQVCVRLKPDSKTTSCWCKNGKKALLEVILPQGVAVLDPSVQ